MSDVELQCLDFIAVAAFALDVGPDGVPVYCAFNRHACNGAGLKLENVIGKTARDVYPGRGGQAAYARHLEAIATGKTLKYEVRLPLIETHVLIQTTLVPVTNTAGEVVRLYGTSVDVTQDEHDRHLQARASTITHEMEDFITMAAHDLRTPMRNVHNIADMLRDDFKDHGDGKLELIDLLEDVAIKATSLISDVLAHAQATKAGEDIVVFDFAELCRDLCDILDPLNKHNVTTSAGIITGDKTAYQIVLRNLLDNAFKHGGRDALTLSITLSEGHSDMMQIAVRDDGLGFENPGIAFLESGKLRTDSGFGLLGIRRLVQSRGGQISAEVPEIGRGSLIRFTLPGQYSSVLTEPTCELRASSF